MAKKKDKEEEIDFEEKQVPEKPKSKSEGIKLPVLIGIIAGIIIIPIIVLIVLFKVFIAPTVNQQNNEQQTSTQVNSKNDSEGERNNAKPKGKVTLTNDQMKLVILQETGRITTNPKGSSSYAVVNLGIEMFIEDEKEAEELRKDPEKSILWKKVFSRSREVITNTIGNYTLDDLKVINRDSLKYTFYDKLFPIFTQEKVVLVEVILQEFMMQE
jgi:hypothetical protein